MIRVSSNKMQVQIETSNGNYFETDFKFVALYNSELERYEVNTMKQAMKDRECGATKGWVIADMFYHRWEATDYVEKNR